MVNPLHPPWPASHNASCLIHELVLFMHITPYRHPPPPPPHTHTIYGDKYWWVIHPQWQKCSKLVSNWISMSCQPHRVTSGQSNSCKPMRKGMMLLSEHLFCSVKCIMFDLTVKTYNKHNMGDSQLCDEDLISSCWFSGSPVPFWHKHAHNYRKEQQQIVCMSKQSVCTSNITSDTYKQIFQIYEPDLF